MLLASHTYSTPYRVHLDSSCMPAYLYSSKCSCSILSQNTCFISIQLVRNVAIVAISTKTRCFTVLSETINPIPSAIAVVWFYVISVRLVTGHLRCANLFHISAIHMQIVRTQTGWKRERANCVYVCITKLSYVCPFCCILFCTVIHLYV